MGIIVDICLAALLAWKLFTGYRRGLSGILLGIARIVVSFAVAIIFGPAIGNLIDESSVLSRVLSYIGVFIVAYIACTLIMTLLKQIKIPLVTQVDKLLGMAVGGVFGLISIAVIVAILYSLLYAISKVSSGSDVMQIYESSYIFKFINEFNIFGFIKDILI